MPSSPRPIPAVQAALEGDSRPVSVNYTITELAQEFEITPRAIRFYEDLGLLQPRREGRHRIYSHRDRTRLKLTLRGKRLGLPLQDIKQLVDMYETGTDTRPQLEAFIRVLQAHRRQLAQQLEDIQVTMAEIDEHEGRCRQLLEKSSPGGEVV